jgi:hypothetical protein
MHYQIPAAYKAGNEAAWRAFRAANIDVRKAAINTAVVEKLVSNATGRIYEATAFVGRRMADAVRQAGIEAVTQKVMTGSTVKQAKANLIESLKNTGILGVVDKRGREIKLEDYATMVARTTTREATNQGSIDAVTDLGYDLVRMSQHYSACELCSIYEGRVYSISGASTEYPPLDQAFPSGYTTIHPNCAHVTVPYFPEFDDDAAATKAYSNRPFDVDPAKKASIDAYNKDQAIKAARAEDRREWENSKKVAPKDTPPTFSGYRALKRADNEKYKALRKVVGPTPIKPKKLYTPGPALEVIAKPGAELQSKPKPGTPKTESAPEPVKTPAPAAAKTPKAKTAPASLYDHAVLNAKKKLVKPDAYGKVIVLHENGKTLWDQTGWGAGPVPDARIYLSHGTSSTLDMTPHTLQFYANYEMQELWMTNGDKMTTLKLPPGAPKLDPAEVKAKLPEILAKRYKEVEDKNPNASPSEIRAAAMKLVVKDFGLIYEEGEVTPDIKPAKTAKQLAAEAAEKAKQDAADAAEKDYKAKQKAAADAALAAQIAAQKAAQAAMAAELAKPTTAAKGRAKAAADAKTFKRAEWDRQLQSNATVARKSIDASFDPWRDKLTGAEEWAVQGYTGNDFRRLNAGLREGARTGRVSLSTEDLNQVKNISSALQKASLPREMILRRGSDTASLRGILGIDSAYIQNQNILDAKAKFIGDMKRDTGFMSTTPYLGSGFDSNGVEYRIKMPKGSKAQYVDPFSKNRGEEEIIVDKNTQFIIQDIIPDPDRPSRNNDYLIVYLEVIP